MQFPDDLLAWWRLMDGVDDDTDYRTAFTVPGGYMPLSVARVREEWTSLSVFPDQDCCQTDGLHQRAAGDATFGYCTALLPVCRALDGAVRAIDLRPGSEHGCVMDWSAQAGAHRTAWASVTALLADTAQRLDRQLHNRNPAAAGRPDGPRRRSTDLDVTPRPRTTRTGSSQLSCSDGQFWVTGHAAAG